MLINALHRLISQDVLKIRKLTGASLNLIVQALQENNQNIGDSIKWLEKAGIKVAKDKLQNDTCVGCYTASVRGSSAVIACMKAQTDFVCRNQEFQSSLLNIVNAAYLEKNEIDDRNFKQFMAAQYEGVCPNQIIQKSIQLYRENCTLLLYKWNSANFLYSYVHNHTNEVGLKSTIVEIASKNSKCKELDELAEKILLQITTTNPKFVKRTERTQKKEEILYEQEFVLEDEPIKVKQIIKQFQGQHNDTVEIKRFITM